MGRHGSRTEESRWSVAEGRGDGDRSVAVLGRRDLLPRPDMLHQRPRLRRRLELVFLGHPPGEFLVRAERSRPIAGAVEQTEHSPQGRFVIRLELDGAPGPSGGVDEMPFRLRAGYERACRRCRALPHAIALAVEPFREFGRRPGDVQSLEQGAAIERDRPSKSPLACAVSSALTSHQSCIRHSDLVLTPTRQHLRPQLHAQEVERAAQGGSRVLLVELRPEQREKGIAAMESARGGDREIGQHAQALGLPKH